ncbi:MAG: ABC transporter ATP-binding protein [Thermodesulfobacteriota bacterium]|jgi:branched-chain amino acid transport system ATP-binding protein
MLFEIKDLRVHYGRAEVLKGISICIEAGTIVTLIGANGAGKTTTLRTISGLKIPTSGQKWFQGERIDGMSSHQIVKIGIAHVPEGRIVFAPMTVIDNLRLGAYLRKDKHQVTKDLDNMYDHFPILRERRLQKAGSLSGGEQQMLAIARALMSGPKLLLMDEPSMGLSPMMVEEVGKIIRDINQSNKSIMLVEQNARLALKLANKAYILEVGRIVLEGTAQQIANDDRVKKAYLGD